MVAGGVVEWSGVARAWSPVWVLWLTGREVGLCPARPVRPSLIAGPEVRPSPGRV